MNSPLHPPIHSATAIPVQPTVATQGLCLSYGDTSILKGVDLALPQGQTLALLGPSGCGKTTLLRLVAGLLHPTEGSVSIDGRVVAGPGVSLPPEKRGLGMVFQDYALWPHMTVAENVAFPLEMRGVSKAERETRTMAALTQVGLAAMAGRSPSALSGGQQQRVAIARAIVAEPKIVLFDEPLSNLDRELRETMVEELGALIRRLGLTAIYVTHDQSEALTLADRVAVMSRGQIAQLSAPDTLIEEPATPEVAEFLRLGRLLRASWRDGQWHSGGLQIGLCGGPSQTGDNGEAHLLIPPRAVQAVAPEGTALRGKVEAVHYRDASYVVTLSLQGPEALSLQLISRTRPVIGSALGIALDPAQLRWFPL